MKNKTNDSILSTRWYHYVLAFFVGVFLVNVLPHYIHGITGELFPTSFANPPGKGLSSPSLNVVWAVINFLIGFSILYFAKLTQRKNWIWIAVFAGGVVMSFYLANYFESLR